MRYLEQIVRDGRVNLREMQEMTMDSSSVQNAAIRHEPAGRVAIGAAFSAGCRRRENVN
jgi:hypothetical protein